MQEFVTFMEQWWEVIAVGIIVVAAVVIHLRDMWKGNIVEWIVGICAEMEIAFGDGTGFLKLRGAYDTFVRAFPVMSKIISFETFSGWVDVALAKLNDTMKSNTSIKKYINGVEGVIGAIDNSNVSEEKDVGVNE